MIGDNAVAERGTSECLLSVDSDDVDAFIARARAAGAAIVAEPEQKPWGYTATFADPDGHLWMVGSNPASRAVRPSGRAPRPGARGRSRRAR